MKLDRELQREMLMQLAEVHPAKLNFLTGDELSDHNQKVVSNLLYLEGHGLVIAGIRTTVGRGYSASATQITSAGFDFLADDGGLSAILGVVTVRLHEDTIRDLISSKIQESNLPEPEKKRLIDQLRELRGESIKHLTMKLLDKGMENLPAAILAIQTAIVAAPK